MSPKTRGSFHFFETEKDRHNDLWVVITKKVFVSPPPVSFAEAVAEAIKQGLVDSRAKTLSAEKYAIRFTKRRSRVECPIEPDNF